MLTMLTCLIRNLLGGSDHSMIHLVPVYKTALKSAKPAIIQTRTWSTDSLNNLKACFECTDWTVLCSPDDNLDQSINIVSSYINFCVDLCIPQKVVTCYPNNKPWITKELKATLNEKKKALASKDKDQLKHVQSILNKEIKTCKTVYKNKIEQLFNSNKSSDAWKGLSFMSGYKSKSCMLEADDPLAFANELNEFYNRFDTRDEQEDIINLVDQLDFTTDSCPSFNESEVKLCFKQQKSKKAPGPDNIAGRVIKECCEQLAPIFTRLFNQSLSDGVVPVSWKTSTLIPVPKPGIPQVKNDLRPVALTDLIMKRFEHLFAKSLIPQVKDHRDKLQFAYQEGLGVDDAILSVTHQMQQHLDQQGTYIRALFIDFSSAFNTISPVRLANKLISFGVNSYHIRWIVSFLTNRKQCVKYKSCHYSSMITTNTGAPQGCVLSPLLFTLYTSDCRSEHGDCSIIKYADDTVILGQFHRNTTSHYFNVVHEFVNWCQDNHLNLNVKKTKEMVIDFRRIQDSLSNPILIDGVTVERVQSYKYLGTVLDNKLNWSENTKLVCNKVRKRLFFLRKLREFHVNATVMRAFYDCVVHSVLTFSMICWYGSLTLAQKKSLFRLESIASYITGENCRGSLNNAYINKVLKMVDHIISNQDHCLNPSFNFMRSGARLRAPNARTSRFKNSFIPKAITVYNHSHTRQFSVT